MLTFIRKLLSCFRGLCAADQEPSVAPKISDGWNPEAYAFITVSKNKDGTPEIPEAIEKQYAIVIPKDYVSEDQGVCLTSDVAVLGNVSITAGGTCITGDVLVFGDVEIDGKDATTLNGTCITGDAIVLGDVKIKGDVCVDGDVFVKGSIYVEGKLKVGGKLCYWGQKDIRPVPPS